MARTLKMLVLMAGIGAGPALAHEKGSDRAMGLVDAVTPERIAIRTSDGHVVEFVLTSETRFSQGKARATAGDVRVGERAVVRGARKGEGLTAVEVKLAPERK